MKLRTATCVLFVCVFAAVSGVSHAWGTATDRVKLTDVQSLILKHGRMTTGKRSAPIEQLKCIGSFCQEADIDSIFCKNAGSNGKQVNWDCKLEDDRFDLKTIQVGCEGYTSSQDDHILEGSCGATYRLKKKAGATGGSNYGGGTSNNFGDYSYQGSSNSASSNQYEEELNRRRRYNQYGQSSGWTLFGFSVTSLLFYGVIAFGLYLYCSKRNERQEGDGVGGGDGGGGGGGGGDNSPPPYGGQGFRVGGGMPGSGSSSSSSSPSNSGGGSYNANQSRGNTQTYTQQQQQQQQQQPAAAGGAGWGSMLMSGLAGYVMGGGMSSGYGGYNGYGGYSGYGGNSYLYGNQYGGYAPTRTVYRGWGGDSGYSGGGMFGSGGGGGGGGGSASRSSSAYSDTSMR